MLADPRWLPQRLYFQRWMVDALGLAVVFGVWFGLVDDSRRDLRPKYTAIAVALVCGPASGFGYMFTNLCDSALATNSLEMRRTRNILFAAGAWSWLMSFWISVRARKCWQSVVPSAAGGGTGLHYNGGLWGRGAIADWAIDGVGGNFHLNMCYCVELYLAVCCAGYYVWRLLVSAQNTREQSKYPALKIVLSLTAMYVASIV